MEVEIVRMLVTGRQLPLCGIWNGIQRCWSVSTVGYSKQKETKKPPELARLSHVNVDSAKVNCLRSGREE